MVGSSKMLAGLEGRGVCVCVVFFFPLVICNVDSGVQSQGIAPSNPACS